MRMRAIAVGQNRKTKLAIAITKQKRRVSGHAAAVRKPAFAIAYLHPPSQPESRGLVSPQAFNRPLELRVLARQHLLHRLLADQVLAFEDPTVEIRDQPVCFI